MKRRFAVSVFAQRPDGSFVERSLLYVDECDDASVGRRGEMYRRRAERCVINLGYTIVSSEVYVTRITE